jgi:vitamin B12 transporter
MKKKTVLFLCAGTFLYSGLQAQSKPDTSKNYTDSIKTVTVTATRTEKDVMDVGRSVTVISGDQLKQPGCNTVADLLSRQEGIFVDGAGQNPGGLQTMFLRGADNSHSLIMIDGVPITDPSTDHGEIYLSELSLADVDKIEIIRGSHSTLYGSSAIGGVINIITNNNYTPGLHGNFSETGGEFGPKTQLLEENAFLNYTFKNGIYAEGGYHRIDDKGLSSAVDTLSHPLPYQQNPQNNFDKGDVFSRIGFKDQNLNTYFEYRNTNQTFGLPIGAFEPANNYNGSLVRDYYNAFIKYNFTPQFHIQYNGSYSPMDRKYTQDTTVNDVYNDKQYSSEFYTSKTVTNDVQLQYDFKTSQFIIGGGSNYEMMNSNTDYSSYTSAENPYYYPGMDQYYISSSSLDSIKPYQTIYNAFAQADINGATFAPGLKAFSLLLGARYSSNSTFGNNVSYEINPSFKINPNSLLYFSFSTGFNAPSLYQLYGPDDIAGDPISLGNTTLTPETSNSVEFGLKHRISTVYLTLSYFSTVVNNYIDYVYLWNKNKPVDSLGYADFMGDTYLNVGQETTQGIEMSVSSQLDKTLSVSANVSILSSSLTYSNSSIDTAHTHGNYVQLFNGGNFLTQSGGNIKYTSLLRRPGDMANITLTYRPVNKLSLSIMIRYVGQRTDAQYDGAAGPYGADVSSTLADYTLLDASASYNITKHFSATLRGTNLFNTTYYEILGYTTMGRSFFLNLQYAF